ncbi:unnamed protein product, partial [Pylaiella littoralis]
TSTATYLQEGTLARGVVATTVGRAAMVIPARSPTPYGAITPAARTAAASRAPARAPALLDPTGPAAARRRDERRRRFPAPAAAAIDPVWRT